MKNIGKNFGCIKTLGAWQVMRADGMQCARGARQDDLQPGGIPEYHRLVLWIIVFCDYASPTGDLQSNSKNRISSLI